MLTGTDESDVIIGLGGNDVIDAGDEADLVCGGPGNDRILTGDDGFLSSPTSFPETKAPT